MPNDRVATLGWTWHGIDRAFRGSEGNAVEVNVRGVTVVHRDGGNGVPLFERYVDWLDVLGQLGIGVASRRVRPDPDVPPVV